jgi:pimeloyl-ACP methyl ester carboxylesterase
MKPKNNLLLLALILLCTSVSFSQETGKNFIISLFKEKDINKSYEMLDESIRGQVSANDLEKLSKDIKPQLGEFVQILEVNNENSLYYYYCEFKNTKIDIKVSETPDHKIDGFFFVNHKVFNKPNSPGKILNIKSGTIDLQGTLLVPETNDTKKLVILVAGSGPQDRDETIGDNKPFKDIAEGLYKEGISSYRFDKSTYTNPESFNDKSGIDNEYTNDIISVIDYFRKNYSEYEIILLGHSLGGYILPKVGNKVPEASKLILMASNARQLDELVKEQLQYLGKVNPSPELVSESEKFNIQYKYLNSKNFNLDSPKEKLPLGLPAAYWKSLKDYNVEKEAKKLNVPVFVLQGERDYQVTMTDFKLWQKFLSKNKKSEFKSYPKLNHMFMPGEGNSSPQEYIIISSVSSEVIQDIAKFIKG